MDSNSSKINKIAKMYFRINDEEEYYERHVDELMDWLGSFGGIYEILI